MKNLLLLMLLSFTVGYSQTKPNTKTTKDKTTETTAKGGTNIAEMKKELALIDSRSQEENYADSDHVIEVYEKYENYLNAEQLYFLAELYKGKISREDSYTSEKGKPYYILKAQTYYEKAADKGSRYAMSLLGNCYYYGNTYTSYYGNELALPKDVKKAEQYFERLVKLKGVEGMLSIANSMKYADEKYAEKWYERAVATGDTAAMREAGGYYEIEKKDKEKAMIYYKKAADKGDKKAMQYIGDLYYVGGELSPNNLKAIEWYEKSGTIEALYSLMNMYYWGRELPNRDYAKAKYYAEKIIEKGNNKDDGISEIIGNAYFRLGYMYGTDEKGVDRDYKKSIEYYEKSIEANRFMYYSLVNIGEIYYMGGDGIAKDLQKAESYFNKAVEVDNDAAIEIAKDLWEKGGYVDAKKWYDKAIKIYRTAGEYEDENDIEERKEKLKEAQDELIKMQKEILVKAAEAYSKERYTEAAKYYKDAIECGLLEAEERLASMYYDGKGVPQDYTEAFNLYLKAAEKDNLQAIIKTAEMYNEGKGVTEDKTKAIEWYLKAAHKGDSKSMQIVADAYQEGTILNKDIKEARYWYEKAANRGEVAAMLAYGKMLENGIAGSTDKSQAIANYKRAAEEGNTEAMALLGYFYEDSGNITEAKSYYEKALSAEEPLAMRCLGRWYATGSYVERNEQKAFELYEKAANKQDAEAMFYLAEMYEKGITTPKDNQNAFYWYKKAADAGVVKAMNPLADLYKKGKGVEKDKDKATYWYNTACNNGAMNAICKEKQKLQAKLAYKREYATPIKIQYGVNYTSITSLNDAFNEKINMGFIEKNSGGADWNLGFERKYWKVTFHFGNNQITIPKIENATLEDPDAGLHGKIGYSSLSLLGKYAPRILNDRLGLYAGVGICNSGAWFKNGDNKKEVSEASKIGVVYSAEATFYISKMCCITGGYAINPDDTNPYALKHFFIGIGIYAKPE